MVIIIIISATVLLLWILVYPTIIRLYRTFLLGKKQIEQGNREKENSNKPISSEIETSIVGKSTFILCQPLPTITTPIVKEPISDVDASTFATESDPQPMDIDYPLNKDKFEDEIDEEQETIELKEMFGKDVCFASGVVIEELHTLKHVIESSDSTKKQRAEAGKILYENRETEIVEQLSSGKTASIISNLIDLHITDIQEKQNLTEDINDSEELENFDINRFLNPK